MADDSTTPAGTDDTTPGDDTSTTTTPSGGEPQSYSRDDLEKIVEKRLARERKKYADYDDLKAKARASEQAAKDKQTVEERLEQLQRDLAERDTAAVQEKADLAAERLHAKLVRGGLTDDDATALVGTIDPLRLLSDGKPSTEEIDRIAKTLTKIGTRATADPDQGRKGGNAAPSMNDLIRNAAGRTRV